jgi:hypothetical protein
MLRNLYKAGTAFFTHLDCLDFDIVVPIRYSCKGKIMFAPLLISVLKINAFIHSDVNHRCLEMENKVIETGCHRALGLVVAVGSSAVSKTDDLMTLSTRDGIDLFDEDMLKKKMVAVRVLHISMSDQFGISKALQGMTLDQLEEKGELFTSHSLVRPRADDKMSLL